MKYWLVGLLCLLAFVMTVFSIQVGDGVKDNQNDLFTITVNTHTPVAGGGYQPYRKYYCATNIDTAYDVIMSTGYGNYRQTKRRTLKANGGWWEDKYNIWMSTWYFIITSSVGAPANTTPLTATVEIQERY